MGCAEVHLSPCSGRCCLTCRSTRTPKRACALRAHLALVAGHLHVRAQVHVRTLIHATVLAGGILALGCSPQPGTHQAPSGSTVSITQISPGSGSPLTVGEEVKLEVSAAYALSAEAGTLGVIVQDAKGTPLAQTVNVVLKGGGTEKLQVSFTVPDTSAIHVFAPLSAEGQTATSTVASRSFRVKSK
jgi:hypothetical protein